jgi:hypothetical protein
MLGDRHGRRGHKAGKAQRKRAGRNTTHDILPRQIRSAPKGPRTITHKQIKAAVEKVFKERALNGGSSMTGSGFFSLI